MQSNIGPKPFVFPASRIGKTGRYCSYASTPPQVIMEPEWRMCVFPLSIQDLRGFLYGKECRDQVSDCRTGAWAGHLCRRYGTSRGCGAQRWAVSDTTTPTAGAAVPPSPMRLRDVSPAHPCGTIGCAHPSGPCALQSLWC